MNNSIVQYVRTEKQRVLESGVLLINGDKVVVGIAVDNFTFETEFQFKTEEVKGSNLRFKRSGENVIVFECINFEDLGTGTSEPIQIAIIRGRKLFISFFAERISGCNRRIEYSFLMDGGDSDG